MKFILPTFSNGFIAFSMCCVVMASQSVNANTIDEQLTALERANAELQHHIQRVKDSEDIENLISLYGYYLEHFMWDALASLFTEEDSSIEIANRGVYVSRKRVRDSLELYGVEGLHARELHPHNPLQAVIHIAADGQSAKVRRRAWLEMGIYQSSALLGEGVYEDTIVKRDGRWQFKTVHFMNTFFAPYEGGWEKVTQRTNPGVNEDNPPDLPPTLDYGIFPEVYIPEFHYQYPNSFSSADAILASLPDINDGPLAELAAQIKNLANHVARLQDQQELRNLQRAFGYYFDKQLWDKVVALFGDGASFEVAQLGIYQGRDSMQRFLASLGQQPIPRGTLYNHMQLQPIITVAGDGKSAKARWHLFAQLGEMETYSQWGEGIYENDYIKQDGVWKISKIHYFPNMMTDYQRGWAKQAFTVAELFSDAPPPDQPPSIEAKSYPDVFVVPFHYANPATRQ